MSSSLADLQARARTLLNQDWASVDNMKFYVNPLLRDLLTLPVEAERPEVCVCAALQLPNGRVYRGHRHDDAIMVAGKAGVPRGTIANAEQGFMTTGNRFVDRYEGMRLQRAAGKQSAQYGEMRGDMLFSEDLYMNHCDAVLDLNPSASHVDEAPADTEQAKKGPHDDCDCELCR